MLLLATFFLPPTTKLLPQESNLPFPTTQNWVIADPFIFKHKLYDLVDGFLGWNRKVPQPLISNKHTAYKRIADALSSRQDLLGIDHRTIWDNAGGSGLRHVFTNPKMDTPRIMVSRPYHKSRNDISSADGRSAKRGLQRCHHGKMNHLFSSKKGYMHVAELP